MIGPGNVATVVQRLVEDPAIIGLGDLEIERVLLSRRPGQAGFLLEDRVGSSFYVVELQLGPTDDRQLIRLVERWAAERKRQRPSRCFAVLVAEEIALRYLNLVHLISSAVPLLVRQLHVSTIGGDVAVEFTRLR